VRTESEEDPEGPSGPETPARDFDGFFRQHFTVVARTAALVVHDFEAGQDMAQESFARLYVRWERMESLEHARNFVFKVAVNLARSHLRRERRQRAAPLEASGQADRSDETAAAADRLTLAGALSGLSGRQRACLALVDYAGLDVRTSARFLRMRPSTVRVHLTRGRRALAEALESTYQERSHDD
jgi:RNA polymerase sigma-70 factor, ECF subfamily